MVRRDRDVSRFRQLRVKIAGLAREAVQLLREFCESAWMSTPTDADWRWIENELGSQAEGTGRDG